jgi:hypothetical protein
MVFEGSNNFQQIIIDHRKRFSDEVYGSSCRLCHGKRKERWKVLASLFLGMSVSLGAFCAAENVFFAVDHRAVRGELACFL